MSNEIRHYFGPYLEIKVNKVTKEINVYSCKNKHEIKSGGHSRSNDRFCSKCGEPVRVITKMVSKYPAWLNEILPEYNDELDELVSSATPPSLFGNGTIIMVVDNSNLPWLILNKWGLDIEIAEFPTDKEIQRMKDKFLSECKRIIVDLRNSDIVRSVIVKAGYVLDAEF